MIQQARQQLESLMAQRSGIAQQLGNKRFFRCTSTPATALLVSAFNGLPPPPQPPRP